MKKNPPSRSERAKLREEQILDAAKRCFSRVGFHSTSMAQIAAEACMSVGQIYRHFPSKESLIEGIVREDIAHQLAGLDDKKDFDVVDLLTGTTRDKEITASLASREHLALMLEIVAEAARNRKVRDIVLSQQRRGYAVVKKRIASAASNAWPRAELDLRLRLISGMVQGVVAQVLLDPRAPSAALVAKLREVAAQLLLPPTEGGAPGRQKG